MIDKLIVVDTNIIFSALKYRSEKLRELLFEHEDYHFIAPNFLFVEIFKHKERILAKSPYREDEIIEYLNLILAKVRFVNEDMISIHNYIQAYHLCKAVDENDTTFVALSLEFNALFWTKDEKLKAGLKEKGFNQFFEY